MAVLVINCGSSSLKYAVFKNDETLLTSGKHERLVQDADAGVSHAEAVATVLRECKQYDIECVGHRVVHGGALYHRPQLIDATVLKAIEQYIPAAPMHNPRTSQRVDIWKRNWNRTSWTLFEINLWIAAIVL